MKLPWIVNESVRIFPAFLFFFLSFNLVNLTEELMFHREKYQGFSLWSLLLGALIVAKVLLFIDHLSFVSLFSRKPLIYSILWKTCLYSIVSFFLRVLILLYPFIEWTHFTIDTARLDLHLNPARFFAIQVWYGILFFIFVAARELLGAIGRERMIKILFKDRGK